MSRVIVKNAAYDYKTIRDTVFEMIDATGGERIGKGSRVLIKPNLLAPASPEKAMLTHPLIVRAAAEYCLDKGARLQISDSPAMGTFNRVLKESGIRDALKGLDVSFSEFRETVTIDTGPPFNRIEIARDAIDADMIINLPKLKTHTQMLLTLGIKNLFGCVVGLKKPEWHFRTGIDREMFARLLVLIYKAINPGITVLDGVLAMEGQGPGRSGTPRHLGVILAGSNAADLDITVCRMFRMRPDSLLTNKIAIEMGLASESAEIEGILPEIKDFKMPEIIPLVFGPKRFHRFMRKHLTQRPEADHAVCRMCGECWRYCPAAAITGQGNKISFDYDKCIRCYCCIEVCPHGALKAAESTAGKVIRRALDSRTR